MANGRMINHAITKDLRINQLSDDTSRLAFTWLVTFADREGRTYGDPAIVRSMLFPRREDVTIAAMEFYIQEWHSLGLVIWYEAAGDKFIFFPAFDKNQPGMRKERESASIIPPPPGTDDESNPELIRSNDGVDPEECRNKLKEIKLKEKKGMESTTVIIPAIDGTAGEVYRKFENEICMLTPAISDTIDGWLQDYSADWIKSAIDEAVKNNVRKPVYINKILQNWKVNGPNGSKPVKPTQSLEDQGYHRIGSDK